jgi:hypothetical protein
MRSRFIFVDTNVALNNKKPLNFAVKKQEWVCFEVLSSYRVFRAAVNNRNALRSTCKVPHIFVQSQPNLEFDKLF